MKKAVAFLGLLILALYCFSQSTVYEVKMTQGIVVNTHVSTTTAKGNQCDSVEDNFRKCQYEKIGVSLNLVKETEQCRSFFSSCGQAVLDFCESIGKSYSGYGLYSQTYYDSLFCDSYKNTQEKQRKEKKQVEDSVTKNINSALLKIRRYYENLDVPLNAYPATQPFK